MGGIQKDKIRIFSVAPREIQIATQGTPVKHKIPFSYCKGGQTMEQVAQAGCGISILGGI